VKAIGGWCDCYDKQDQAWYTGLYCEGSKVLNSAQMHTTYPTHIISNQAVTCGGHGREVNGACQCDTGYDATTGCIEVTSAVKLQRQWDVCICEQYAQLSTGAAAIEFCTGKFENIEMIQTRSCADAAAAIGRLL